MKRRRRKTRLGQPPPRDVMLVADKRGDYFAVERHGWSDMTAEVKCWPGPKLKPKTCRRDELTVAKCGAVLIDMGGRFDCMPVGITILGAKR